MNDEVKARLSVKMDFLIGRKCRIETKEGGVRVEQVAKIGFGEIELSGFSGAYGTLSIPRALYFDAGEVDGIELHLVKSIALIG